MRSIVCSVTFIKVAWDSANPVLTITHEWHGSTQLRRSVCTIFDTHSAKGTRAWKKVPAQKPWASTSQSLVAIRMKGRQPMSRSMDLGFGHDVCALQGCEMIAEDREVYE